MSPTPSEPLSAGFSSDSLPIASGYFSAALPVNGDLVGGLPIVPTLPGLVARADVLQTGRLDWTGRLLNDYAIIALNNLQDNAGGDYRGDWSNPLDDAFVYAGDGLLYNQSPSLSSLAGSIVLGPDARLGYAPVGLEASDRLVRLAQPVMFELPIFGDLKAGALAGGLGPESVVDMSQTGLNSVADVAAVFPSGLGARRVFRVQNGGLNLPDGVELSNMVIIVERGDINFNGAGQRLRGVTLIAENGSVNLSGVVARDVSVLASGSIHMNREARFSGENLLATEGGSVIFNGATETIERRDSVKVVAGGGDLIFNAAADTRGEFWTAKNFFVNQTSTLVGEVRAKQNVTLNARLMIMRDTFVEFNFPIENQPTIAVIDTGFSGDNPDIDYGRITQLWDWVSGDSNPLLAAGEGNEHGTHTLGLIAATRGNNLGIDGANGTAPIYVSRAVGSGQWAKAVKEFLDRFEAESGQPNPLIYLGFDLTQRDAAGNVSTRYELTLEDQAVLGYARQKGALIVVPSGNDGGVMSALGQAAQEFDNIVTVGAVDGANRASYSSYGAGLTLMAPGGSIDQPTISTVGNGLGTMAGTSVAAARAAGEISQVWAANPGLSYQQVIDVVKATTFDVGAPGWDEETAFGVLDVKAAVELAKKTAPEKYDPPATILPDTWAGAGIVLPLERAANWATDFQAWVVPTAGANVRQSPNTQSPIIGTRPYGANIQFTRWTYGQRVNDIATGQPDERWYYDAAMGGWIASAIVGGNAPGSTPLPPVAQPTPGPTPDPTPRPTPGATPAPTSGPVVTPGPISTPVIPININSASYQNGRENLFAANSALIGQCTWYAYGRMLETGLLPAGARANGLFLGNAEAWRRDAARAGLAVNSRPTPGARGLVVWPPSVQGGHRLYGHVAFVEEVYADGSIRISESNWAGRGVGTRTLSVAQQAGLAFIPMENARTSPQLSSPSARPGQQREYRVRAGDTLSAIAQRELGNANRWREIQKADGRTFTEAESRLIQIGQSIYLPISYKKPSLPILPVLTPADLNPKVLKDINSLKISTQNIMLKTSYKLGMPIRPDIKHDDGFSTKPKESPSLGDYLTKEKWLNLARGASVYMPDAAQAYFHYIEGGGKNLDFSYEEMLLEDNNTRKGFKAVISDIQQAAENIFRQILGVSSEYGKSTQVFNLTGGQIIAEYPDTENWQKAIGGHSIWSSAKVTIKPGLKRRYSMEYTLHAEDRYNFNPGQKDITSQTPDDENGRLVVVGLANEYMRYSTTATRIISWEESDYPRTQVSFLTRI
jgi:surface antigen/murein DD-endopeptidase MepM/ murein hydrolase activator NlpD